MKTIEPVTLLTKNSKLNKFLLSNADLECEVSKGNQLIKMLYREFDNKHISRESLIDILYSRYEINKHIHEYNHYTLVFFASLGLEHDKIIHVNDAYLAKYEIISQFKCLDELKEDSDQSISLLAEAQSDILRNFLCDYKDYANVFALLDQSICRTVLDNVYSGLIVEQRRDNFTYHNYYSGSRGVITYSADKYEFSVKMPMYRVSDKIKRKVKMHFDACRLTSHELRAKKSNLTLEELVNLVHVFFEYVD